MLASSDIALTLDALTRFLTAAEQRQGPVISQPPMASLTHSLDAERLIAQGGLGGESLAAFWQRYFAAATNLHHPHYMAHQVAVPHPLTAAAALVDGVTNNAMAIYEMGPAAAALEQVVLSWMLRKIGWPVAPLDGQAHPGLAGGVLTHGGSLANLTALSAARARVAPQAWSEGVPANLVVVAPASCHYSLARAVGILGLGEKALIAAPLDELGRILPLALDTLLTTLRADGKTVMAVVANACATAAGLYDPLEGIAHVCQQHRVWMHVDGAHGASALASDNHRHRLQGIDRADSVIWDAHKMMRTPTVCAAVLVKDHRDLDGAFHQDASYLFHDKEQPGFDFIHRTVECTKSGLGLKAFFALAAEGEQGLAAFIDRQTALAQQAAAWIRQQDGMAVAVEPETNIVCFCWSALSDTDHLELRKRLTQSGDFYISSTEFLGRRWLRVSLMNPATTLADVQALIARLTQEQLA